MALFSSSAPTVGNLDGMLKNLNYGQRFVETFPQDRAQPTASSSQDDHIRAVFAKIGKISTPHSKRSARDEFYKSFSFDPRHNDPDSEKIITDRFLSVADSIKDPGFFWEIAGDIWIKGGGDLNLWKNLFGNSDFQKFPTRKRIKLWNEGSIWENYAQIVYDKWTEDKPIVAYRVFRAKDGQSVRGSNSKFSPDFSSHSEGWGMSYTLSRLYAYFFSAFFINREIIRRYGPSDTQSIADIERRISEIKLTWRDYHRDQRVFIGKFHIKKRDVIGVAFRRGEEEIVSEKSELINYAPVTFRDFSAATSLVRYFEQDVESGFERIVHHRLPERKLMNQVSRLSRAIRSVDEDHDLTFLYGAIPELYRDQELGIPRIINAMKRLVVDRISNQHSLVTYS